MMVGGVTISGAGGVEIVGSAGTAAPVSVPQMAFGGFVFANGLDHFQTGVRTLRSSQSERTGSQLLLDWGTGSRTAGNVYQPLADYTTILGAPIFAGGGGAGPADALSAPDAALVRSLQSGADIPVPCGSTEIRTMMSDLTLNTGNEVALLRMADGSRILRMGGPRNVPLGNNVETVIAHTHPSGRLAFSQADIAAFLARGQRSSVIIDPNANMGARIPVPRPLP
jgi:hypothetical protein